MFSCLIVSYGRKKTCAQTILQFACHPVTSLSDRFCRMAQTHAGPLHEGPGGEHRLLCRLTPVAQSTRRLTSETRPAVTALTLTCFCRKRDSCENPRDNRGRRSLCREQNKRPLKVPPGHGAAACHGMGPVKEVST